MEILLFLIPVSLGLGALGLAILSAVATARTTSVLDAGHGLTQASNEGFQLALLTGAFIVLAATVIALLTPNSRETASVAEEEPALELALTLLVDDQVQLGVHVRPPACGRGRGRRACRRRRRG